MSSSRRADVPPELLLRERAAGRRTPPRIASAVRARAGPAQPLVAEPGVERVEVDAARPQRQPRHRQVLELSHAGRGRRQGPVREGVDLARQVDHGPDAAGTEPGLGVALGETDQVGLVDRHARDAELHGRARRLEPERGRRGDVDHVGAEPQHLRTQPGPRLEADAEVPVERQRRPASGAHREPGVRRGAGRGHQLGLVPLEREVLQHPADRVGDAVDLREERLRDDQDTQRGVRHVSDGREATATGSQHSCNGA